MLIGLRDWTLKLAKTKEVVANKYVIMFRKMEVVQLVCMKVGSFFFVKVTEYAVILIQ
jgi:hypothetical protein